MKMKIVSMKKLPIQLWNVTESVRLMGKALFGYLYLLSSEHIVILYDFRRNSFDISKKVATLNLTNQLFRIYYRVSLLLPRFTPHFTFRSTVSLS